MAQTPTTTSAPAASTAWGKFLIWAILLIALIGGIAVGARELFSAINDAVLYRAGVPLDRAAGGDTSDNRAVDTKRGPPRVDCSSREEILVEATFLKKVDGPKPWHYKTECGTFDTTVQQQNPADRLALEYVRRGVRKPVRWVPP